MTNHMTPTGSEGMGGSDSSGMSGMFGMMECDGTPIPERQGNWQGHVFPGSIFLIWATHWLISASWRNIVALRTGRPFQARSTEGLLPMVPALNGFNRYPVESILKAIGGFLLFILQITYGGYKQLVCNDGIREDRIMTQHLNSWAHASMNLGFSLSGFVELIGHQSRIPHGTNMVVLSSAFFIEAMLFSLHEKNGHLDQTLHWLLAQTCWAGAVFSALEAAYPESFMLSAGRIGSLLLQGTWFCQAASVLFGGDVLWSDEFMGHEDEAPAMFLPMIFAYHMLLLISFMVAVYVGLEAISRRMVPAAVEATAGGGSPSFGGFETSRLLSEDDGPEHGMKSVPMASLRDGLRRA